METNKIAKANEIIVLGPIPSLKKWLTNRAYIIIPIPNPTNLVGHIIPSKPCTVYLVPQIYRNEIGIPAIASAHSFSRNHFHINWPFNWKNVIMCAIAKHAIPVSNGLIGIGLGLFFCEFYSHHRPMVIFSVCCHYYIYGRAVWVFFSVFYIPTVCI